MKVIPAGNVGASVEAPAAAAPRPGPSPTRAGGDSRDGDTSRGRRLGDQSLAGKGAGEGQQREEPKPGRRQVRVPEVGGSGAPEGG